MEYEIVLAITNYGKHKKLYNVGFNGSLVRLEFLHLHTYVIRHDRFFFQNRNLEDWEPE